MTKKEKEKWGRDQPEAKARQKAYNAQPERRERQSELSRAYYAIPEVGAKKRKRINENQKQKYHNDPEWRARFLALKNAKDKANRLACREAIAAFVDTHPGYR